MTQEQYERMRMAADLFRQPGRGSELTEYQAAAVALLEAFEELYHAADAALFERSQEPDLSACLFDSDGNAKLRVRKP